jgi:hypothetical protein
MSEQQTAAPAQDQQPVVTQATEPEKTADGKFIYRLQPPTDDEGKPIGREFVIKYTDQADLIKQLEAKTANDIRYVHEIKTGKRPLKGEPEVTRPEFKPAAESQEDADKRAREEFRKRSEQEYGATPEQVRDTLKRATEFVEYLVCNTWALNHEKYQPTAANAKALNEYLKENKLRVSAKNLDLAFEELNEQGKLALKSAPDSTQQQQQTDSAQDQSQRTSAAAPPEEKKTQSTGMMPGQFAGARPNQPGDRPPLSAERYREINRMTRDQFNKLGRTNKKEYDAFVTMKAGRPA